MQTIFSCLSTKIVRKLQTVFQTLMKTITVFINVNKNCLQDIFCVRDCVAVSQCFCHGVHNQLENEVEMNLGKGFVIKYFNRNKKQKVLHNLRIVKTMESVYFKYMQLNSQIEYYHCWYSPFLTRSEKTTDKTFFSTIFKGIMKIVLSLFSNAH